MKKPFKWHVGHVSIYVGDNTAALGLAVQMMCFFGWKVDETRHPNWGSGESVFVTHGSHEIQLTYESDGSQRGLYDATHVAFIVEDLLNAQKTLAKWLSDQRLQYSSDVVGDGKVMFYIDKLSFAIELIVA